MKKIICAIGAAALLSLGAGAANASTVIYKLTADACTGTCGLASGASYGTLTVEGVGTNTLDFDLKLTSGIVFNLASNGTKPELFSLMGGPAITISDLTTGFSSNGAQTAGNIKAQASLGHYDYQVLHTSVSGLSELKFTVTSLANNLQLAAGGSKGGKDIYFTADVLGPHGQTGSIGATYFETAAVPEPATWAMMMVGVAGVGGVLRRKRALAGQATAA